MPDEQKLVLAHVLCGGCEDSDGDMQYSVGQTLRLFNGQRIYNLRGLAEAVDGSSRWMFFEMESGNMLVLDGETTESRRSAVMAMHRILRPVQLRGSEQ